MDFTVRDDLSADRTRDDSFFGIRGVGSIYYLAFALQKHGFDGAGTPMMRLIDRRQENGVTERESKALDEGKRS